MHVRRLAAAITLFPFAACAQVPAQTPAQAAAQEMIRVYEEFCLVRFPDPQAFAAGADAHHMAAASAAQSAEALLGRPGQAWALVTPKGTFLVATESGGRQGCAVSGDVADDAASAPPSTSSLRRTPMRMNSARWTARRCGTARRRGSRRISRW